MIAGDLMRPGAGLHWLLYVQVSPICNTQKEISWHKMYKVKMYVSDSEDNVF